MKYIAYCRKSTDEKNKQVLSIDQQIAELKEYYGIDDKLVESSIPSSVPLGARSPETPENPDLASKQQDLSPVEQDFEEVFGKPIK